MDAIEAYGKPAITRIFDDPNFPNIPRIEVKPGVVDWYIIYGDGHRQGAENLVIRLNRIHVHRWELADNVSGPQHTVIAAYLRPESNENTEVPALSEADPKLGTNSESGQGSTSTGGCGQAPSQTPASD